MRRRRSHKPLSLPAVVAHASLLSQAAVVADLDAALSASHDRAAAAAAAAAEADAAVKAGKDSLLRLNAEFQNFRNRTEREKTARALRCAACVCAPSAVPCARVLTIKRMLFSHALRVLQEISDRVKGNVLEELIPLIDNFEAAKQYIKARPHATARVLRFAV